MLLTENPVSERFHESPVEPAMGGGDRRRKRRQEIEVAIVVLDVAPDGSSCKGLTRNMSSGGGVSFDLSCAIAAGQKIRYIVMLSPGASPVQIACAGRTVRCLPNGRGGFEIAATMERYKFVAADRN